MESIRAQWAWIRAPNAPATRTALTELTAPPTARAMRRTRPTVPYSSKTPRATATAACSRRPRTCPSGHRPAVRPASPAPHGPSAPAAVRTGVRPQRLLQMAARRAVHPQGALDLTPVVREQRAPHPLVRRPLRVRQRLPGVPRPVQRPRQRVRHLHAPVAAPPLRLQPVHRRLRGSAVGLEAGQQQLLVHPVGRRPRRTVPEEFVLAPRVFVQSHRFVQLAQFQGVFGQWALREADW